MTKDLYEALMRVRSCVGREVHDDWRLIESALKQCAEKDAALNLLREIASIKRHDLNGQKGYATTWLLMFVRPDLMDRIDAIVRAANKEPQP